MRLTNLYVKFNPRKRMAMDSMKDSNRRGESILGGDRARKVEERETKSTQHLKSPLGKDRTGLGCECWDGDTRVTVSRTPGNREQR